MIESGLSCHLEVQFILSDPVCEKKGSKETKETFETTQFSWKKLLKGSGISIKTPGMLFENH